MAPAFPKDVVLVPKSNYRCLAVAYDNADSSIKDGSIRAIGDRLRSPFTKFNLEKAKTRKGMFNIRCCYNNKYVMMEAAPEEDSSSIIIAGADVPNEDPSQWSSTLVELVHAQDDVKSVQIRLVYNRKFLALQGGNPHPLQESLYAGGDGAGLETQFTVINWDNLLNLPKYVAFKGDNGKYIRSYRTPDGSTKYVTFDSSDIGDLSVVHEVTPFPDGSILISPMGQRTGNSFMLWHSSYRNVIIPTAAITQFEPVKAGSNSIGLRCSANKLFCSRCTAEGVTDTLVANSPSITREATMIIEEPLLSREIFDVDFRLMHSRIYDQTVITMITRDATNYSSTAETMDLKLVYTDTTSRTWDRSLGLKLGYSATMSVGIPLIVEGSVTMSAEFEGSYKWGDTLTSSAQIETTHTITVPPKMRVKARLLATRGKCDVPFSYTQRDVLVDGREVIEGMDDGIYTGINTYNFKFETTEEKL